MPKRRLSIGSRSVDFHRLPSLSAGVKIENRIHVQLDPMQYTTAQLGEEQVFDVELDRHTELLPIRDDVRAVSWEDVQSTGHAPAKTDIKHEEEQEREQDPGERTGLVKFDAIWMG